MGLALVLGHVGTAPAAQADGPGETTSSWALDGDARDSVGDRHGEALAGVTFAGGSARFAGRDDSEIRLPYDRRLEPGEDRWRLELTDVVPGPLTGTHQAIATSRSTTNQGWAFYIMPGGEFRFWSRVVGQSAWAQFATGVVAQPGTSYDVTVTWEPGTVTVEIDGGAGRDVTSAMAMPVINTGNNPIRLGNGGDRGSEFFYRGSLGGVALSATPRAEQWARCEAAATTDLAVTPPDPAILDRPIPQDEITRLTLAAARNASRYVTTTYWNERFAGEQGERINLAQRIGNTEDALRGPAMASVSTAILLATGAYDPADTGVSEAEARERVVRLASSAAAEHRANDPGGWGTESRLWQASLWAYYNGLAAWLLWDDFSPAQRACVTTMVAAEADAMPDPEYYRDAAGTIVRPGNTQAEENAWRSSLSGLAAIMMPGAAGSTRWRDDALALSLAAWATPQDVTATEVVNGRRLDQLLDGSNVEADGTVENHNLMHPIYMLAFDQNVNNALAQQLTGQLPAAAFLRNVDLTYEALVDLDFPAPPWLPPGGTIYVPGEPAIYYPDGNDWGTTFPLYFAQADVIADSYGIGGDRGAPPSEWAALHLQAAVDLQNRFPDGHTYLDTTESNYRLREERTAQIAAHTFLTRFLNAGEPVCLTDRPYTTTTTSALQGEMELAWQAIESDAARELPPAVRDGLRADLERVAAASNRGQERAAIRLLQRRLDRTTVESPVVDRFRAAVHSAATCVLELPGPG
ncbi:LamG-like jellyroll fold domain-containing protein [Jiangella endophytica]|uniref:LamG-like jellyroll fold domain-containing protein n=1 Tax=Jiangella endophytica TaxID=1623398 RepID=UPI000E350F71|nr:LamG-like jellyroll fold domain-containing protein [Jiangella endophytica]